MYFQRSIAVIVGIDQYSNGIRSLQNAANDAQALAKTLEKHHDYEVKLLLNHTATGQQLRYLLTKELPQTVKEADRLLFYFAGHGIALDDDDGPNGYLIPQDAQEGKSHTYLPMTWVHDAIAALPCRHFFGIFDCCFAGAFRWSSTRDIATLPDVIHQERYVRFTQDPAWQILTSAASDQKALDILTLQNNRSSQIHSPFAQALLDGLQGAADIFPPARNGKPSGDGVITATELYLYLRDRVETQTLSQVRQTPGIWPLRKHDKGEYIFLVPGKELNLPPAPELRRDNNPYRGLETYTEKHHDIFFGRARLIEALKAKVGDRTSPLTIVLGESGSGKSSLVQAGLIPSFQQEEGWHVLDPMRPGESPLQSFWAVLHQLQLRNTDYEEQDDAPDQTSETWITKLLFNWHAANPQVNLLIVIDQFEELSTLCRNPQESQHFLQFMKRILKDCSDYCHIVLTLRSDFEPQFTDSALKSYWIGLARFVISPMEQNELRQAIEEPASKRVIYFESSQLVDQLINEVLQTRNPLPLLSFTLSELYFKYLESERSNRSLIQADYDDLGGVANALTHRATQEYESLNELDQQIFRRILLRMVTITEGNLTRRRVSQWELEYAPADENNRIQHITRQLIEARLIVSGRDIAEAYVEPAHDILITGWHQLKDWAKDSQDKLTLWQQINQQTRTWRQKPDSRMSPSLLKESIEYLRSHPADLNQHEQACIRANQQARRRTRIGAIAATLTGFIFLGGFGWWLQQESRLDRQLQATVFNAPEPAVAQELIQKIPRQLNVAESALENGNETRALEDYRTILAAMRRMEREATENPQKDHNLSKENIQRIREIGAIAERSLADVIRVHRLPLLEQELADGNFGQVNYQQVEVAGQIEELVNLKDYEDQFTGALRITYALLLRELGAKADINDDSYLNDHEEELLPCLTLEEIERLWRKYTNNRCGWYGLDSRYNSPLCRELGELSLMAKLTPNHSRYLMENRLENQCKVTKEVE